MKQHFVVFALASLAMPLLAAEPSYLCKSNEQIIFGCSLGAKVLSLCASSDMTSADGYAQYRFGTAARIEFQYPEQLEPPNKRFFFSTVGFSGGGEAHIRFSNAGYEYIIFDRTIRTGFGADGRNNPKFQAGVVTRVEGKVTSTRLCKDSGSIRANAYKQFDKEQFEYLDVP